MRVGKAPLVVVTVAALIQLPIADAGPFDQLLLAEIAALLLLMGVALQWSGRLTTAAPAMALAARVLLSSVGVYAAVIAVNFLRSRYVLETTASVTRPFYAYFVALGIFLLVYLALTRGRVPFEFLFRLLYWLAVVTCVVGIVAVVLDIPLSLGNQAFSVTGYRETTAVRVGFLDIFGMIGLALVVTRPGRFRLVSGVLFAGALFASGGRSATLGIILALVLYLLVARRWAPLLVTAALAMLVIPLALPQLEQQSQFKRLTNIGSQARETNERAFYYRESIVQFRRHPLIGTGIGAPAPVFARDPEVALFYQQQLQYGGHATYNSLLKNFGLAGFLPFVAALLAAIVGLGRLVARGSTVAGVFFVLLVAEAVALYASGNGADSFYFFVLGGAAAVMARSGARAAASRSTAS
jgi:hypothetical protein